MSTERFAKHGSKVVIIGTGQVGSSIAYALTISSDVHELVLVDQNHERAVGEAMDLSHGLAFVGDMHIYAGDYSDVKDADVIVITAGASQKPGEPRMELVQRNCQIGRSIAHSIMPHYTSGVLLIVANPVDVLTYKYQQWTGLPASRVIGSGTTLDSLRFRFLLSEHFHIDVQNVHGYIIGEHGDSQIPAWSATNISGLPVRDFARAADLPLTDEMCAEIGLQVKQAADEIIRRKGATYYGVGIAVSNLTSSLIRSYGTIRPVSSAINGPFGIEDSAISLPTIISSKGIEKVLELELSDEETRLLRQSATAVRTVLDDVADM